MKYKVYAYEDETLREQDGLISPIDLVKFALGECEEKYGVPNIVAAEFAKVGKSYKHVPLQNAFVLTYIIPTIIPTPKESEWDRFKIDASKNPTKVEIMLIKQIDLLMDEIGRLKEVVG